MADTDESGRPVADDTPPKPPANPFAFLPPTISPTDLAGMLPPGLPQGVPPSNPRFAQPPGVYGGASSPILRAVAPHLAPRAAAAPAPPAAPAGAPLAAPAARAMPIAPKPEYRDPLTALGNPITLLALVGSLFTRRPATTALQTLGAAMKAQREGDQQAFADKYTQYQGELKALHEETVKEHYEYQRDWQNKRLSLQERTAGMRRTATRRGDRAMLSALDSTNPMVVEQIQDARQKAADLIEQGLTEAQAVRELHKQHPELSTTDLHGLYQRTKAEKKQADALAPRLEKFRGLTGQELLDAINQDETLPPGTADLVKARASGVPAKGKEAPLIDHLAAMYAQGNIAKGGAKQGAGMSGNQRVKEVQRLGQIDESLDKIDSTLGVLNKYRMAAGVGGMVTRGKEIVENIFGSNDTDREQFRRDIEYLRLTFPRIMGGGRPLASDQKRVDAIIGGLNSGDTTANTIRSLEELRNSYLHMRSTQEKILNEGQQPAPSGPGTPMAAPPAAAPTPEVDLDSLGPKVE